MKLMHPTHPQQRPLPPAVAELERWATSSITLEMKSKPTVLLYAQDNAGLIIPWLSGVIFQQQTGGYTCLQDSLEGVFVPLDDFAGHAEELHRFFTGPKWGGNCDNGIDDVTADFIDATLGRIPGHSTVKVDRGRLTDSHEAWIYVTVADPYSTGVLDGFSPCSAILTWPNSD